MFISEKPLSHSSGTRGSNTSSWNGFEKRSTMLLMVRESVGMAVFIATMALVLDLSSCVIHLFCLFHNWLSFCSLTWVRACVQQWTVAYRGSLHIEVEGPSIFHSAHLHSKSFQLQSNCTLDKLLILSLMHYNLYLPESPGVLIPQLLVHCFE